MWVNFSLFLCVFITFTFTATFTYAQTPSTVPTLTPSFFPTINTHSPTASPSQGNWHTTTLPFSLTEPLNGKRLATSYNGQNVAITTSYGIYASTDYGNNFQWANAGVSNWGSITSDSSGNNMYALNGNGYIYFSNNNLLKGWASLPSQFSKYSDIATDSSGSYLYALWASNGAYSCSYDVYSKQYFIRSSYVNGLSYCDKVIVDSTSNNILILGQAYPSYTATSTTTKKLVALSTNGGTSFTIYTIPNTVTSNVVPTANELLLSSLLATSYTSTNTYVYYVNNGKTVERSINQGKSFYNQTTIHNADFTNVTTMASSGNGQYVVLGGMTKSSSNNAEIWLSNNYGASFFPVFPTQSSQLAGAVISSTGSSIYVVAGQYVYSYQQG